MESICVYPAPVSRYVSGSLGELGIEAKPFNSVDEAFMAEPLDGWPAAVVSAESDLSGALVFCRELRQRGGDALKILLILPSAEMGHLDLRQDSFNDFCLLPSHPGEITKRLEILLKATGTVRLPEMIEYEALMMNLETYQASIAGERLDLTYMEYELLKFLASHPGRVFTREILLSRVWGYEYYGGARTVDVHIRRLRAKLGDHHANLIQTIRSVGYRFGSHRYDL